MILPYDLLCPQLRTRYDVADFIERFGYVRTIQHTLGADVADLLDVDEDSDISLVDRDSWLDDELKKWLPIDGRLPWGVGQADSDPLGVCQGRENQTLIIDPLNSAAVKVTTATNDCVLASSGIPDGSLFNGDNSYRRRILGDWWSLDEMSFIFGFGLSHVRRFPIDGSNATVYVRGGSYTWDFLQVGLCRNNNAWQRPEWISIRNYPGEVVTINTGPTIIPAGNPGDGFYYGPDSDSGKFQVVRDNVKLEGLDITGWRMINATQRVFEQKLFHVRDVDAKDSQPLDGFQLRKVNVKNNLGIPASHSGAAATPHYVDAAYGNRSNQNHTTGAQDEVSVLPRAIIRFFGRNTRIVENRLQLGGTDHPAYNEANKPQSNDPEIRGDAILGESQALNSYVARNVITGNCPHNAIGLGGAGSITEHNDVSNISDICIAAVGVIRYNRIWNFAKTNQISYGIQLTAHLPGSVSGEIYGNVFYGAGSLGETSQGGSASGGIGLFRQSNIAAFIDGYDIHHNVFYGNGISLFDMLGFDGVRNVNMHDNAFVDLLSHNKSYPLYFDAPVLFWGLLNPHLSNYWGQFRNNLIRRTDGATKLLGRNQGGNSTYYDLAGLNALPGCSGNHSSDPLFKNATNGDFTLLADSPLSTTLTYPIPLKAIVDNPRSLAAVCHPIWAPQFGRVRPPRRISRKSTQP